MRALGHFSVSAEQMELVAAELSKQLGHEGGAGAEFLQGRNGWSLWMSHGLPKFFTAEGLTCGPEATTGITGCRERCPVITRLWHLGSGWEQATLGHFLFKKDYKKSLREEKTKHPHGKIS